MNMMNRILAFLGGTLGAPTSNDRWTPAYVRDHLSTISKSVDANGGVWIDPRDLADETESDGLYISFLLASDAALLSSIARNGFADDVALPVKIVLIDDPRIADADGDLRTDYFRVFPCQSHTTSHAAVSQWRDGEISSCVCGPPAIDRIRQLIRSNTSQHGSQRR